MSQLVKFNDSLTGSFQFRRKEASNACVNTHRPAEKKIPLWFSSPLACPGQRPQAPLNTEFHSVDTRSANAFDQDQLTAGRGLFLFQHPVLPPFSALDPHWPLPLKAPAFPHGNAGTRHRSFSFLPAILRTLSVTL